MKVAVVHDYLNQYGGAERVLENLHRLFPEAPIYTSIYDPRAMPAAYREMDIRTSFMQRLPFVARHHQAYLLLYALAFESFDFSGYDLVISNSSAWAKGVVVGPDTWHLCYCLTPMRWVWGYRQYVERERLGAAARLVLPPFISMLRVWDQATASRVDCFATISTEVSGRIEKYYGRSATVIHPPIDASSFKVNQESGDFFLVVSRLVPYKRIDIAVEAFNRLGLPLIIVGDGRARAALERQARPNVRFLGRLPDPAVRELYSQCRALIFPGREDFGIAPLEAQASGRPVIAFAAGGALDTVVDGETGILFSPQTADALQAAVRSFDQRCFDPRHVRGHAEQFDVSQFDQSFLELIEKGRGQTAPSQPANLQPHERKGAGHPTAQATP